MKIEYVKEAIIQVDYFRWGNKGWLATDEEIKKYVSQEVSMDFFVVVEPKNMDSSPRFATAIKRQIRTGKFEIVSKEIGDLTTKDSKRTSTSNPDDLVQWLMVKVIFEQPVRRN